MTPVRLSRRLYDPDQARYGRIKIFCGEYVEVGERSYRYVPDGRVRCYVNGFRVPRWFYDRKSR